MVVLPSVRHLRHLIALAEHGHFGQAAAACHVTQSTLSASIKELENVLEAALVDRTKRRVALTPLGLETVNRARRIIVELEELAHAAGRARAALGNGPHGCDFNRRSLPASAGPSRPTPRLWPA